MTKSFLRARRAAAAGIVASFAYAAIAYTQNPPSTVCDQNARQDRPFQLGVSGGNSVDRGTAAMTCFEGTLGSIVEDSKGRFYILSTNKAFARGNRSITGAPIVQPGLADTNCRTGRGNIVARLTKRVELSFAPKDQNSVDAAIARVVGDKVGNGNNDLVNFGIQNVPLLADNPVAAPPVFTSVQKMGGATCLTMGSVQAVAVDAAVTYGLSNKTANFKCQIAIAPMPDGKNPNTNVFSSAFDSGALVLTAPQTPAPTPTSTMTPTPATTVTPTSTPTSTPTQTPESALSATATPIPTEVPIETDTPTATPTFVAQPVGVVIANSSSDPTQTLTIANPICAVLTASEFKKFSLRLDNTGMTTAGAIPGACMTPVPTATAIPTPNPKPTPTPMFGVPTATPTPEACPFVNQNPAIQAAVHLRDAHEAELMNIPGAVGTGIGISDQTGQPVIQVYLRAMSGAALDAAPSDLEGTGIILMETGDFVAN